MLFLYNIKEILLTIRKTSLNETFFLYFRINLNIFTVNLNILQNIEFFISDLTLRR